MLLSTRYDLAMLTDMMDVDQPDDARKQNGDDDQAEDPDALFDPFEEQRQAELDEAAPEELPELNIGTSVVIRVLLSSRTEKSVSLLDGVI